jgi:Holliday junction DNA helicase RuvB
MSVVLNGNSDEAAVNLKVVNETLESLGVDVKGLTPDDRQLLKTIANTFSGGPVGVDSLASTTDLDKANIIENIEPVLLRYELITRGLKGRSITKLGLEHLILTGEG